MYDGKSSILECHQRLDQLVIRVLMMPQSQQCMPKHIILVTIVLIHYCTTSSRTWWVDSNDFVFDEKRTKKGRRDENTDFSRNLIYKLK